jgi:leader peptidase (prepilin peptidase)/N-methyltransferase
MLADFRQRLNAFASPDDGRSLLTSLTTMSWRTRAFVAVALGLVAGAAFRYQNAGETVVVAVYIAVLVACAATDLMSFRVPNVITYPAALFAFLAAAFMPHGDLREALTGGALAAGFMLVVLVVSRGGMGLGDVKLAVFVGLALGWPLVGDSLFLMALSGGVVAVVLLATGLRSRKDPIPYAPFISAAAIAVILWQGTSFTRF